MGGTSALMAPWFPPTKTTGGDAIQLPYYNHFKSIWEYHIAFNAGEIDFLLFIGSRCPICGREECYREITPYRRLAIDLLPYREERIWIARFQCTTTLVTFSLLPVQLLPYHRYTVASLVYALLLAQDVAEDEGFAPSAVAEKFLPISCRTTGFLIVCWLLVIVRGLRVAHPVMGAQYNLGNTCPGKNRRGWLNEVCAYFSAFTARGPPGRLGDINALLNHYSRSTGRFLFGTPSQDRRGRCAR